LRCRSPAGVTGSAGLLENSVIFFLAPAEQLAERGEACHS
jgi:hypothetical protein